MHTLAHYLILQLAAAPLLTGCIKLFGGLIRLEGPCCGLNCSVLVFYFSFGFVLVVFDLKN